MFFQVSVSLYYFRVCFSNVLNTHKSNQFVEMILYWKINDSVLSLFSVAKKLDFRYNFWF